MPHQPNSVQPYFEPQQQLERKFANPQSGCVYLVGGGPGDPGLLTLRGLQCLERADVVLYDGLASDQLLEYARQADWISVGKHGSIPLWTQGDINSQMLELARQGKRVVRLKGGDPAVFARTAEELELLASHSIPFEVVPGITAALAAASYVGIPITHRRFASAVAFVTGQQQSDEPPQEIDWESLARFPGTLVFYMGVTTVRDWTTRLMAAGKASNTPAAIVRRCTWTDQTVVRCTLEEVADALTPASKMRPPVIVIVGAVAQLGENFDWFSRRPLHGCGVLVTRPREQQDELTDSLRELGADVYCQPLITIDTPESFASLDQAIDELSKRNVAGITFSSSNGVDGLFQRLKQRRFDARLFANVKLAVVGAATARQLEKYGLRADIFPPAGAEQSAAGLLQALSNIVRVGEHWWITTSNRSQHSLRDGLASWGVAAEECLAYVTRPVDSIKQQVQNGIETERIHYVTITSNQTAEIASGQFAEHRSKLKPIAISKAVAARLDELGWPAFAIAAENSASAITQAVLNAFRSA